MKKQKLKSLVKKTRKTVKKDITSNLVTELKAVADKLVPGSKKIDKAIKKDAKGLAKKIAKEIVIDEAVLVAASKQGKAEAQAPTGNTATTTVPAKKKVAPKTPEKASASKTADKAVKA